MKHLSTILLVSACLVSAAHSAQPAKPAAAKAPVIPASDVAAQWWAREIAALQGGEGLFYSGKVVVQARPSDDKAFALSEIKGVIYGRNGYGTVIYAGSAWSVGETRDISGLKILLEELAPPGNSTPGRARFTVGAVSRDVFIEEGQGSVIALLSARGWITDDGVTVALPVAGQRIGTRGWVQIDGLRYPARVTQIEGSWTYMTIARDRTLPHPSVVSPEAGDEVTVTAVDGRSFVTTYRALTVRGRVPDMFAGAAVTSKDGYLIGFVSLEEGFTPATGSGDGRFEKTNRLVECAIEQ